MSLHFLWWIAAAVLVGVEMMTGTFYLLMVALACVAGGIVAFSGVDVGWQWGIAAAVGVVGTYFLHQWKIKNATAPKLSSNLDVGQLVKVVEWRDGSAARVFYRGANWDAVLESELTPKREQMVIVATRGSQLVLGPAPQ
jgi:membrane protein implicated in regulation of membrane protease activity